MCMGIGIGYAQSADGAKADSKNEKKQQREAISLDKIWKNRAGYLNLGYVNQDFYIDGLDALPLKSDWGASLTWGKTFYLHKKPIGKVLKFGLDWSWLDINAAQYTLASSIEEDYYEEESSLLYQADLGMQFGPSITINPVNRLKVSAYFRVSPSYSAIYSIDEESVCGSYVTAFNVGGAIAWGVISLGVEYRTGECSYKEIGGEEDSPNITDLKQKSNGVRFYLGFRF